MKMKFRNILALLMVASMLFGCGVSEPIATTLTTTESIEATVGSSDASTVATTTKDTEPSETDPPTTTITTTQTPTEPPQDTSTAATTTIKPATTTTKATTTTTATDPPAEITTATTTTEPPVTTTEPPTTTTVATTEDPEPSFNDIGKGQASPVSLSDIPSWSGDPYVIVDNNIPNFDASELSVTGYETYLSIDALGRTQMAVASVGKDTMPEDGEERGSISSIKPSGWIQATYDNISGKYLYNRCHLIGWQLSAENANKGNLITGTKYLNIEGMLPFENMVADYIKETGNHVAYRITPIYDGNNLLASGVQMEAYSVEDDGEGICFNVFCYNVQPDININYADGSSTGTSTGTAETTTTTVTTTTAPEPTEEMVWIPSSGTKYHSNSTCSNMKDPTEVPLSEAEAKGFTACKRCW